MSKTWTTAEVEMQVGEHLRQAAYKIEEHVEHRLDRLQWSVDNGSLSKEAAEGRRRELAAVADLANALLAEVRLSWTRQRWEEQGLVS